MAFTVTITKWSGFLERPEVVTAGEVVYLPQGFGKLRLIQTPPAEYPFGKEKHGEA